MRTFPACLRSIFHRWVIPTIRQVNNYCCNVFGKFVPCSVSSHNFGVNFSPVDILLTTIYHNGVEIDSEFLSRLAQIQSVFHQFRIGSTTTPSLVPASMFTADLAKRGSRLTGRKNGRLLRIADQPCSWPLTYHPAPCSITCRIVQYNSEFVSWIIKVKC